MKDDEPKLLGVSISQWDPKTNICPTIVHEHKMDDRQLQKILAENYKRGKRQTEKLIRKQRLKFPEFNNNETLKSIARSLELTISMLVDSHRVDPHLLNRNELFKLISVKPIFYFDVGRIMHGKIVHNSSCPTNGIESLDYRAYENAMHLLIIWVRLLSQLAYNIKSPVYRETVETLAVLRQFDSISPDSSVPPEAAKKLTDTICRIMSFLYEETELRDDVFGNAFPDAPDEFYWPAAEPEDTFNTTRGGITPEDETEHEKQFRIHYHYAQNPILTSTVTTKSGRHDVYPFVAKIMKAIANDMKSGRQELLFTDEKCWFFRYLRKILTTPTSIDYRIYKGDDIDNDLLFPFKREAKNRIGHEILIQDTYRRRIIAELNRYISYGLRATKRIPALYERFCDMSRILKTNAQKLDDSDTYRSHAFVLDMKLLVHLFSKTRIDLTPYKANSESSRLNKLNKLILKQNATLDELADPHKGLSITNFGPIGKTQIVEAIKEAKKPKKRGKLYGKRDPKLHKDRIAVLTEIDRRRTNFGTSLSQVIQTMKKDSAYAARMKDVSASSWRSYYHDWKRTHRSETDCNL